MARSQNSFIKKLKAEKKLKKRKEKEERKKERKENNNKGADFSEMIAYVDADGNISSSPPPPEETTEKTEPEE